MILKIGYFIQIVSQADYMLALNDIMADEFSNNNIIKRTIIHNLFYIKGL
jgi:hypothetical protein